jgi:hypothetical protein
MTARVVFGPTSIGGLGLRHSYVEQGLPKTSALLQHIRQNGRLGQMMWTTLQWTQVTVGVGLSRRTLEALTSEVGHWLPSLREFLASSGVHRGSQTQSALRRVHDRILMEDAMLGGLHER